MRWLKLLGLAAFAGVTATGVVIIRDQRRRSAYTPDEVRDRLHARLAGPAWLDAELMGWLRTAYDRAG